MQVLNVKGKGPLAFIKTWVNNSIHIGSVPGGGYLHLGGQPIKNREEIRSVIPDGPDLVAALEWFNNREKPKPEAVAKKTIIATETGFSFLDGPITSIQEIVNNTAPGRMQELILGWWGSQLQEKEKAKRKGETLTARKVDEIRKQQLDKELSGSDGL